VIETIEQYKSPYPSKPYASMADMVSDQGRYGDTMLMHVTPDEVKALNEFAPGSVTINPKTGLPEAFVFSLLLPLLTGLGGTTAAAGTALAGLGTAGSLSGTLAGLAGTALKGLGLGIGGVAKAAGIPGALLGKAGGAVAKGIGGLLPDAVSETIGQAATSVGDVLNAPGELLGKSTSGLLENSGLSETAKGFVDPTTNPIEAFQGLVDSPSPSPAGLGGEFGPSAAELRDGGLSAPGGPRSPLGNAPPIQPEEIQGAFPSQVPTDIESQFGASSNQLQSQIEKLGNQIQPNNAGFQESLANVETDIFTGESDKAFNQLYMDRFPSPMPAENVTGEMSQGILDAEIGPIDNIYNPNLNPENSNLYRQFMDMPLQQKLMLGAGLGYGTDYIMQLAEVGPYEDEEEWWEDYQGGSSQNPSWRGRGAPSFSSVYPSTREINYYR
jgi:hypothetical protein